VVIDTKVPAEGDWLIIKPAGTVLSQAYEGKPIVREAELIADPASVSFIPTTSGTIISCAGAAIANRLTTNAAANAIEILLFINSPFRKNIVILIFVGNLSFYAALFFIIDLSNRMNTARRAHV
jgi:hypothetical protein